MIKLVVCDIDGTLLKKGESGIDGRTAAALEGLYAKGKKICLASGRTYFGMRKIADTLSFADDIYYVCCDGSVCIYKGKTLYHKPISIENILKFARNPEYSEFPIAYCSDKFSYAVRGYAGFAEELEEKGIDCVTSAAGIYDVKNPIYKIGVYGRDRKPAKLNPCPFELRTAYDADNILEYTSRFADKGLAVSDLQMRLYLSKFDTAALGDGDNDVEMFSKAKYTFARADGSEKLIAVSAQTFACAADVLENID